MKVRFLIPVLVLSLSMAGCTGLAESEPQEASINAKFVSGVPVSFDLGKDMPSKSCLAVDRSSSDVTMRIILSARDDNGLQSLDVVTSTRHGFWVPAVTIDSSSPDARVIRGDRNMIVFRDPSPEGEEYLSALVNLDLVFDLSNTFDDPGVIKFRATDISGNVTETAPIDLRRNLDPPPVTTTDVFSCVNGTAR